MTVTSYGGIDVLWMFRLFDADRNEVDTAVLNAVFGYKVLGKGPHCTQMSRSQKPEMKIPLLALPT